MKACSVHHCAWRPGLIGVATLLSALPAAAMNWEGHGDQLADFPPGIEAFSAGPGHKPLPSPPCPVDWGSVKANPYEQIPLPRHGCPPQATPPDKAKTK